MIIVGFSPQTTDAGPTNPVISTASPTSPGSDQTVVVAAVVVVIIFILLIIAVVLYVRWYVIKLLYDLETTHIVQFGYLCTRTDVKVGNI